MVASTFEDVAGVDEAKQDLQEIVEFPARSRKIPASRGDGFPRGRACWSGPPGTGKTLIARACRGRGECGRFFTISGSDFVEMFVGVGASRVRDMFRAGEKRTRRAIIFIDEIDAVGPSPRAPASAVAMMSVSRR